MVYLDLCFQVSITNLFNPIPWLGARYSDYSINTQLSFVGHIETLLDRGVQFLKDINMSYILKQTRSLICVNKVENFRVKNKVANQVLIRHK